MQVLSAFTKLSKKCMKNMPIKSAAPVTPAHLSCCTTALVTHQKSI